MHDAMRVPAVIFADEALIRAMDQKVYEQAVNVASLPGIVKDAYAMPDAHLDYGFPIGGVAASDPDDGEGTGGDPLRSCARRRRQHRPDTSWRGLGGRCHRPTLPVATLPEASKMNRSRMPRRSVLNFQQPARK